MCFSALVSFTASAFLIPTGIYCMKTALTKDKEYLFLACLPLGFGIQQGFEGMVWLGLTSIDPHLIRFGSLGFLFFSHWFWLAWVPLSTFMLEHNRVIKKTIRWFIGIGILYGALMYVPLLINESWLSIATSYGSIDYQLKFLFNLPIPILFTPLFYTLVIILPLLISSDRNVRFFGILILASAVFSYLVLNYAFVSIWCLFAALLSCYVVYVVTYRIRMISANL
jgi:hypothetical protein